MGYQIYKFCQNSVLSLPFVLSTPSIIVKENTENSNYAAKDINKYGQANTRKNGHIISFTPKSINERDSPTKFDSLTTKQLCIS